MKVSLSDVLACIPAKINVNPNDYVDGTRHPSYWTDLAQAKKWNACIDYIQNNLMNLAKTYNDNESHQQFLERSESEWKELTKCEPEYQLWNMKQSTKRN